MSTRCLGPALHPIPVAIVLTFITAGYSYLEPENRVPATLSQFGEWNEKVPEQSPEELRTQAIALGEWPGQHSYTWSISEKTESKDSLPIVTLLFRPRVGSLSETSTASSYTTVDSFVGAIQLGDYDGDLLTVWTGGSAYHVVVFGRVDNKLRPLGSVGMKFYPQLLDVNDDGSLDILVPSNDAYSSSGRHNVLRVYRRTATGFADGGYIQWTEVAKE